MGATCQIGIQPGLPLSKTIRITTHPHTHTPGRCHALASTTQLPEAFRGFRYEFINSNSCGDDFFLSSLGPRPLLDIQDSQRVFHLSYFFVFLRLHRQPSNQQIATGHPTQANLHTQHTRHCCTYQMRQMQMLLFACFGVSPTLSLALASLTTHPVPV